MRKALNWKHTTKKRHSYELSDKRVLIGNPVDGEVVARKQAKFYNKRNTPFMEDSFNDRDVHVLEFIKREIISNGEWFKITGGDNRIVGEHSPTCASLRGRGFSL